MLSEQEVLRCCQRLHLSSQTQALLKATQSVLGSQSVEDNNGQDAPVCYANPKMMHNFQTESIPFEMAFLLKMEQDDNIREFYDRPLISLPRKSK